MVFSSVSLTFYQSKLTAMEPSQATQTSTPVASTAPSPGVFGTKIPSSSAFLLAIVLFLLPFAEIRCNGAAVANNTGLGIATGAEWKEVVTKNIFGSSEWLRIQKPKIKFKTRIKLQLSFKRGARMSIFLNHYST